MKSTILYQLINKDYEISKKKKEKQKEPEDLYSMTKLDLSPLVLKAQKLQENINAYRKNPTKDLYEESDKEDDQKAKRDLKLNLQYWKKNFLYPFSLRVGNTIDEPELPVDEENFIAKFMGSKSLKFDVGIVEEDHKFAIEEVSKPLKITKEDIVLDLGRIYRNFPINYIPHVDENNKVIDTIHNYR